MVSVDKKTKIFPAPKNEAAVKKEAAAQKKDEGQPKDKSASGADLSKAEDGEKAADSLSLLKIISGRIGDAARPGRACQ